MDVNERRHLTWRILVWAFVVFGVAMAAEWAYLTVAEADFSDPGGAALLMFGLPGVVIFAMAVCAGFGARWAMRGRVLAVVVGGAMGGFVSFVHVGIVGGGDGEGSGLAWYFGTLPPGERVAHAVVLLAPVALVVAAAAAGVAWLRGRAESS